MQNKEVVPLRRLAPLLVGDWVQARNDINEMLPDGTPIAVIAPTGSVGHVWGVDGDWATVTFEKTGMTSDCHTSELLLLGDALTGR